MSKILQIFHFLRFFIPFSLIQSIRWKKILGEIFNFARLCCQPWRRRCRHLSRVRVVDRDSSESEFVSVGYVSYDFNDFPPQKCRKSNEMQVNVWIVIGITLYSILYRRDGCRGKFHKISEFKANYCGISLLQTYISWEFIFFHTKWVDSTRLTAFLEIPLTSH